MFLCSQRAAAQNACGIGIVTGSSFTDLPAAPIRPFCSANGFSVTTSIEHDEFCTTGADVYVMLEAKLKGGAVDSRFAAPVTGNIATYFSNIVYAPAVGSPALTATHILSSPNRIGVAFRFRINFPASVTTESVTFPFAFAPNFFFGDVPWTIYTAISIPDASGAPVVPPLPPGQAFFGETAGDLVFEAPYFPITGSQNISTVYNLLTQSWIDDTLHNGEAHSIMLLPGTETNPVLTIDVPELVHGFSNPADRGKLFLCPGGQVKVPSGSKYILTVADAFTCTQASKGILVEGGGSVWISASTFSDAEIAVSAKKGSEVKSTLATYINNYKGIRLDNQGASSIPDIVAFFADGNSFTTVSALKPPYSGMPTPNTTKGYGLEIISHPNVELRDGFFGGLNNGVRLVRSSFNTRAKFANINPDVGTTAPYHGYAIWGFGAGTEMLEYEGGLISANSPQTISNSDKGIYLQNMHATINRVGIQANQGIYLASCRLKTVSITNSSAINRSFSCRDIGIRTSNCLPLATGSRIDNNLVRMSNPGNTGPSGTGILLGEGSNVTTPGSVGWILTRNNLDLNGTRWGIRGVGVYRSEFRSNDIEVLNNNHPNVLGMDILNSSDMIANCNKVHTLVLGSQAHGYRFTNVNKSAYTCNKTDKLSRGMEFSILCEGTSLKGSEYQSTPTGLLLRNNVTLGKQGRDLQGQVIQDHGNEWDVSSATHEATLQNLVDLSQFGVDPVESSAFKPASNWPNWFFDEINSNELSFSCVGFQCLSQSPIPEKDRSVEKAVANGSIYNVGLPGVMPKMLENHLYAELQTNPAWAYGDPLYTQFLQNQSGTSTAAFWQIRQGIDALNNRTGTEQSSVAAAEASINLLRSELHLMDSTYASGSPINETKYRQKLAALSAAVGSLQTQLDNIRSARLTQASQLLSQNAAIGTPEVWEQSERDVNALEIQLFVQDSVNSTQLAALDALGSFCPDVHGEAVLRAQVLYNRFVEKEFSLNCSGLRGGAGERAEDNPAMTSHFSVFPNPSTGYMSISGLNATHCLVEVFDITGRAVVALTLTDNTLDLSDQSSGIYLIRLSHPKSGQIGISKVVISK